LDTQFQRFAPLAMVRPLLTASVMKTAFALLLASACATSPGDSNPFLLAPLDRVYAGDPQTVELDWQVGGECSGNGSWGDPYKCGIGTPVDMTIESVSCDGCTVTGVSQHAAGSETFQVVPTAFGPVTINVVVSSDGVTRNATATMYADSDKSLQVGCYVVKSALLASEGPNALETTAQCGTHRGTDDTVVLYIHTVSQLGAQHDLTSAQTTPSAHNLEPSWFALDDSSLGQATVAVQLTDGTVSTITVPIPTVERHLGIGDAEAGQPARPL
jgi:hypothetical protein